MKKTLTGVTIVLMSCLGSWSETHEERQYVNLSFTVWQLKNGVAEAALRINTPIPEVLKESWICDFVSFDVTDGKAATKVVEKDGFQFVLTADYKDRLTIQVCEKKEEQFWFVHNRPSTVNYIFYGINSRTYLIEVTYTADNHPTGLLSPGILKKQRTLH
jgi:hypothetical protein